MNHFSNTNSSVRLVEDYKSISSLDEQIKMREFCLKMGLDVGEIDVVRD